MTSKTLQLTIIFYLTSHNSICLPKTGVGQLNLALLNLKFSIEIQEITVIDFQLQPYGLTLRVHQHSNHLATSVGKSLILYTLSPGIGLHCGTYLNSWVGLFVNVLTRGWYYAMKHFPVGSGKRVGGIKRLLCVSPVANKGLYIEEYTSNTTRLRILQFTHDCF